MENDLLIYKDRFFYSIYYGCSLFGLTYVYNDFKYTLIPTLLGFIFIWRICMFKNKNSIQLSKKYLLFELFIFTLFFIMCLFFTFLPSDYNVELSIIVLFSIGFILLSKIKTNVNPIKSTPFIKTFYKTVNFMFVYILIFLFIFKNQYFLIGGNFY